MQTATQSPVLSFSRGARFLDLVKQNKLNISPHNHKKRRFSMLDMKDMHEQKKAKQITTILASEQKEYLKFSTNPQFNPEASPTSSILSKKKQDYEAPDSSPLTSSAKRKRVGFCDPVSSTKEYLITEEEERLKSNSLIRCLKYDNDAENDEDELDLDVNKENEIKIKVEVHEHNIIEENKTQKTEQLAIMDHDYDESPQNTDITTSEDLLSRNANKLIFKDKEELMDYITKNLSVDELLEKLTQAEEESLKKKELITKVVQTVGFSGMLTEFFPANGVKGIISTEQSALISSILNEISILMDTNRSVKHKVLDVLSGKHSVDFLEHALQENSTSTVCDKITMPKIAKYLIHKINIAANSHDNNDLMSEINISMIRSLIDNTQGTTNIRSREETQELMRLLFKNSPKMEIFDTVHDFLRKLLQNH